MTQVLYLLALTAVASVLPDKCYSVSELKETLNETIGVPNLIIRNATLTGLSSWMKRAGINETGLLKYKKDIAELFVQYTVSYFSPIF